MSYPSEEYQNPPGVTDAQALPESHTLASEEFEDGLNKRNNANKKRQMTVQQAIMATRVEKSEGTINSAKGLFEVVMYAVFLAVLVYVAFANTSSQTYFYTKILANTFRDATTESGVSFSNIAQIDDIWNYLSQVLTKGLYWDNVVANVTEQAMVLYENKLLGFPLLRMLKVHNQSCTVVESFEREIKQCFANYKPDVEDTTTFGEEASQLFEWSSSEELETVNAQGSVSTYGGGGFVVQLPLDDPDAAHITLSQLENNRWIDRGSRALIVDFSLYNANVNLFCAVRLLLELPATGGVIPKSSFNTMNLLRYIGTEGTILIALEGVFAGFVAFFLVEELLELVRVRISYILKFWNAVDIVIIMLSVLAIFFGYRRTVIGVDRINKIIKTNLTMAVMDDAVSSLNTYQNIVSILLFLAWVKVFKYISVNRTMSQLSATLSRSSKDIGGFAVMFSVFFFAYAQFGYLVFGTQIEDYSTFLGAIFALLRTILGDFDYLALQRANGLLGPAFFITYVFFVFFVLLNMFLAIINDAYVEVKAELAKKKDTATLFDWIRAKVNRLMNVKARGNRPEGPEDALVTYDDYKAELMRAGYKESDILETFTKLDIEGGDVVTDKTMGDIGNEMDSLLERKKEIKDDHALYTLVNNRVDALEGALGTSVERLESVMTKLAKADEQKVNTKEQEIKHLTEKRLDLAGNPKLD